MKFLRIVIIVLFVFSLGIFGYSRYVEYQKTDETLPVISGSNESLKIPCVYDESQLLEGIVAYDEKDGDLTEEIMIGNISRFHDKGKCKVTYIVFDSSNQAATFVREIEFTDYQSPEFIFTEPLVFKKGTSVNINGYVGALDVLDGDISSLVRITDSNVNYQTAGEYEIKIEVTNSFGDYSERIFPVHVVEAVDTRYKIQLSENLVYLKKGSKFNASDYVEQVIRDDGMQADKNSVAIKSGVDVNEPGLYEVKYTYDDGNGNRGATWQTVIVE